MGNSCCGGAPEEKDEARPTVGALGGGGGGGGGSAKLDAHLKDWDPQTPVKLQVPRCARAAAAVAGGSWEGVGARARRSGPATHQLRERRADTAWGK